MPLDNVETWLPTIIVALIAGIFSVVNGRRATKAQKESDAVAAEDRVTDHWKDFAKTQLDRSNALESRLSEYSDRLDNLEEKNQRLEDEMHDILPVFHLSLKHNLLWWEWYDNGQQPPPPVRTIELMEAIKKHTSSSDS